MECGQRILQIIKYLGKRSFGGRGQRVLPIIRLNTLADVIRVAKARTSCEYLPIDTNFVSILLLVSADFLVHTIKLKPIIKVQFSGKLVTNV